ncbi:L-galactonate transporter [Blastochloris viridis]|nr:L-galactonate transporter [Blastochloris viridis]
MARLPVLTVVALVATCAGIYVASQFLRNSVGVIAPDLARELTLSASEIGLLSSLFFLVFAGAQVPLGIALDRFGPKACILASVSLAVAGALLFATAGSFAELLVARLLMGLGCAALLMAPLALYARWFPPDRFATLLGIQIGVGNLGTVIATAPLAYATAAVGWRNPFLVVAALVAVAAVLVAVVVRDNPPGRRVAPKRESLADSVAGVAQAIRTKDAWRLFLLHTSGYAMYATVLGLWGGPYLTHVHGFELAQRGNMLLLLAATQIVGSILWGFSDRVFGSYRVPTMLGTIGSAALLLFLAASGPLSDTGLMVWFAAFGLVAAFPPVMMAHGKSLFPLHLVGRGITLMNLANMGGVFVWQALTGVVMDLFPASGGTYPVTAYHTVFALLACTALVLTAIYAGARDPRREP